MYSLLLTLYSNITTSALMMSAHTRHINTKLSTNSFTNILYFNVNFKSVFKTEHFIF